MPTSQHLLHGAGAPTAAPPSIAAHYVDTSTGDQYAAHGTASVGDWRLMLSKDGADEAYQPLEEGLGLSETNFTQAEKDKLATLSPGGGAVIIGTEYPSTAPTTVGDRFIFGTAVFVATGTAYPEDWVQVFGEPDSQNSGLGGASPRTIAVRRMTRKIMASFYDSSGTSALTTFSMPLWNTSGATIEMVIAPSHPAVTAPIRIDLSEFNALYLSYTPTAMFDFEYDDIDRYINFPVNDPVKITLSISTETPNLLDPGAVNLTMHITVAAYNAGVTYF